MHKFTLGSRFPAISIKAVHIQQSTELAAEKTRFVTAKVRNLSLLLLKKVRIDSAKAVIRKRL